MALPPTVASYAAGTSCLGKNLLTARTMLANCAAFREIVGGGSASTVNEALERIYLGGLPKPASDAPDYSQTELANYRPYAIIGPVVGTVISLEHITTGVSWSHGRKGEFDIIVARATPADVDLDDNDFDWIDTVGRIAQSNDHDNPGLAELHESAEYLSLRQISIEAIYRADEEDIRDRGDYQAAILHIAWGRV